VELRADGSGFDVACGSYSIFLENGPKGETGLKGEDGSPCYLKTVSDGYEFWCREANGEETFKGKVVNGEPAEGGFGCSFAEENADGDENISVICGGKTFTMTLCDKRTYDATNQFCQSNSVVPLCNNETYLATQTCARNLIIEVERQIISGTLDSRFSDVNPEFRNTSNWLVLHSDSCFYQKPGEDAVIDACTTIGAATGAKYPSNLPTGDTITYTLTGISTCTGDQYFDLATGKCVGTDFYTIMKGSNTCYSNTTEVPNAQVFARACPVGSPPAWIYYDPNTVKGCDEAYKTKELALTCNDGLHFSPEIATNMDGTSVTKAIFCVSSQRPNFCASGSTLDSIAGRCVMNDIAKKPLCPAGYALGSEMSGIEGDDNLLPRNWCVKRIDNTMCDGIGVYNSAAGACELTSSDSKLVLGSGYQDYYSSSSQTFKYSLLTVTAANRNATLCPNGGVASQDGSGLCKYPWLATLADTTHVTPPTAAQGYVAPLCPNGFALQFTSLRAGKTYPDTLSGRLAAKYNVIKADDDSTNNSPTNLGYFCTRAISQVDCPQGTTLKSNTGLCASNSFAASNDSTLFKPACPAGSDLMRGNQHLTPEPNTVVENTFKKYPAIKGQTLASYRVAVNNADWEIRSKQVCARMIDDSNCPGDLVLDTLGKGYSNTHSSPVYDISGAGIGNYTVRSCTGPSTEFKCPTIAGVTRDSILTLARNTCVVRYDTLSNGQAICNLKRRAADTTDYYQFSGSLENNLGGCQLINTAPTCTPDPNFAINGNQADVRETFNACGLQVIDAYCPLNYDAITGARLSDLVSVFDPSRDDDQPTAGQCKFNEENNAASPKCASGTMNLVTGWCE
jgi:hypothetical protein